MNRTVSSRSPCRTSFRKAVTRLLPSGGPKGAPGLTIVEGRTAGRGRKIATREQVSELSGPREDQDSELRTHGNRTVRNSSTRARELSSLGGIGGAALTISHSAPISSEGNTQANAMGNSTQCER